MAVSFVRSVLEWCGRGDLNPHGQSPTDFLTIYGFHRCLRSGICGLDYPFVIAPGLRRCPSSLYTFPFPGLARDCHFIGFPEFEQLYSRRFQRGTHWLTARKSPVFTNFTMQGVTVCSPTFSAAQLHKRGLPVVTFGPAWEGCGPCRMPDQASR